MSRQCSVVSLGTLLFCCHDISCNVATYLLSSTFNYVATCVEMSRHCLLLALVFLVPFHTIFSSFDLDSCKILILVKIP